MWDGGFRGGAGKPGHESLGAARNAHALVAGPQGMHFRWIAARRWLS